MFMLLTGGAEIQVVEFKNILCFMFIEDKDLNSYIIEKFKNILCFMFMRKDCK